MRPITKRRLLRVFAAAEPDFFGRIYDKFDWGETAAFMATVAEGLLGTAPTCTPVISSRL